jgi:hypothetical protein
VRPAPDIFARATAVVFAARRVKLQPGRLRSPNPERISIIQPGVANGYAGSSSGKFINSERVESFASSVDKTLSGFFDFVWNYPA